MLLATTNRKFIVNQVFLLACKLMSFCIYFATIIDKFL